MMRTRRPTGFTLIEIMLAITIMVMLVATMATTLNAAFKMKRAAERSVEIARSAQVIADLMLDDLRNIPPPNVNSTAEAIAAAATQASTESTTGVISGGIASETNLYTFGPFTGDNTHLAFYTAGPEAKDPIQGSARYVEYTLTQNRNGYLALVRRVETNLLSEADPATFPSQMPEEVLITNVESLSFQFYDGTSWMTDWDTTTNGNTLPWAIAIELQLKPLFEGEQPRIIKRFVSLPCSSGADAAAVEAEAIAADEEEAEAEAAGGGGN